MEVIYLSYSSSCFITYQFIKKFVLLNLRFALYGYLNNIFSEHILLRFLFQRFAICLLHSVTILMNLSYFL